MVNGGFYISNYTDSQYRKTSFVSYNVDSTVNFNTAMQIDYLHMKIHELLS